MKKVLRRILKFQSTLPREERPAQASKQTPQQNFNPRSHERSDLLYLEALQLQRISIHAPTRGATILTDAGVEIDAISIHAPTRGATMTNWRVMYPITIISIHAPTRGATMKNGFKFMITYLFQSTLPREERRLDGFFNIL